jgi:hypothetical protein
MFDYFVEIAGFFRGVLFALIILPIVLFVVASTILSFTLIFLSLIRPSFFYRLSSILAPP